ncbi:putative nucleolus protein [Erysiphe necator]|uniref:25S rRNA adenine-N(1) methyltransferase n=1 Tax=Uncinula necator TaxID=52586 RepID=A0A0B1NZS6_UNCNE|nr:putative nucleolus protein [Erysiphe necator]
MTKRVKKVTLLTQGRPPIFKTKKSLSSKVTRRIIQNHHNLEKERSKALANGDSAKATLLLEQIESQGGIEGYQMASLLGQSRERGGDSSKLLLEWLKPVTTELRESIANGNPLRLLEIGALSHTNACTTCNLFEVERIDLNSQSKTIKKQDFMQMPISHDEKNKFDIISLSLVLNFIPDATEKGNMLLRTVKFLKTSKYSGTDEYVRLFPCLFLVLPAPCVMNSRYMNNTRLKEIMKSLGYICIKYKLSKKLIYYLWRFEEIESTTVIQKFRKQEIRGGKSRNNFCILLN